MVSRAKAAADINWRYMGDAIPAFLTIALMPFTYSIAYGLITGIISYIVINTIVWIIEKISGNRIRPADKEFKDHWTYKIEGGVLPPWLVRAAKGKKDFWRPYEDVEHNTMQGNALEGTDVGPSKGTETSDIRESSSENGEKLEKTNETKV